MFLSDFQIRALTVADRLYEDHFSEKKIQLWTKTRGLPKEVSKLFFSGDVLKCIAVEGTDEPPSSMLERVTFLEQITRRCGATLPVVSDLMSLGVLSAIDVPDEIKDFLRASEKNRGYLSFSFAFTEQGIFGNVKEMSTVVSERDGRYVLNGSKDFVASGQFLPATFVIARDGWKNVTGSESDPYDNLGLWFVPMGSPGVSAVPSHSLGLEMVDPARLVFDNVVLDEAWRIPMDIERFAKLQNQCRFVLCAACAGLAEAAYDYVEKMMREKPGKTFSYFGKDSRTLLAEMHADILAIRLMIYYMARCYDSNVAGASLAVANKLFVCRTASRIAESAMAIAGYDGYADDHRIARIWRDCMGMRIALGSENATSQILAGQVLRGEIDIASSI